MAVELSQVKISSKVDRSLHMQPVTLPKFSCLPVVADFEALVQIAYAIGIAQP